MNQTLVAVIWIDKIKQVLSSNESRESLEKKLKLSLANKEIDSYILYSLETYLQFYKKT